MSSQGASSCTLHITIVCAGFRWRCSPSSCYSCRCERIGADTAKGTRTGRRDRLRPGLHVAQHRDRDPWGPHLRRQLHPARRERPVGVQGRRCVRSRQPDATSTAAGTVRICEAWTTRPATPCSRPHRVLLTTPTAPGCSTSATRQPPSHGATTPTLPWPTRWRSSTARAAPTTASCSVTTRSWPASTRPASRSGTSARCSARRRRPGAGGLVLIRRRPAVGPTAGRA